MDVLRCPEADYCECVVTGSVDSERSDFGLERGGAVKKSERSETR